MTLPASLPINPDRLEVNVGLDSPSVIVLLSAVMVRVAVVIEICLWTLGAAAYVSFPACVAV